MKKITIQLTAFFVIFISLLGTETLFAQGRVEVSPSVTTRHYWRGIMVSNSANFEMDMSYKTDKFTFGAWGGYAFDNTYSEFDFHIGYKFNDYVDVAIWDLYANRDRASIDQYNYFDFDRATTNHLIDATVNFHFGEKFPMRMSVSTMLWGRDLDEHGNQNYSTYLEFGYPVQLAGHKVDLFAGMNVFENCVYGQSTGFVHVGATGYKTIKITDRFSVPVWATVAVNPQAETANLILGITF
ncbi:MAG: hypothetical protein ACEPOZ_18195 [Marinifilaceae bacterium]